MKNLELLLQFLFLTSTPMCIHHLCSSKVAQAWKLESLYMVLITQPVFFNPAISFSCIIFHRIPDFFSQTSFIISVSLCTFKLLSLLRILFHSSQYLILLRKNEIPQKSKKCYIKLHLMYFFAVILMYLINFA